MFDFGPGVYFCTFTPALRLNTKTNQQKQMAKKKSNGEIAVRRVRFNRKSIFCEWENGGDLYKVTFHDNPLASFEKALTGLAPHVCALCELPAKDEEKITPTGITLSPLGDDNEQGLITAGKKIRKGKRVFNISTPLLALWPAKDAEKKGTDCMDDDQAKAITKFANEAKKYILGERAQGKLALGDDEDEDGSDDAGANTEQFPGMTEEPGKS